MSLSIALALSAAAVAAAPAQGGVPPGVSAQLAAEPSELTVGDVTTLSLIVSHPESFTAVLPRLEREWGPFEVRAQTSTQTVSLAGGIRTVAKQFQVTLFAPGAFETPELPISIRGPDGSVAMTSPAPVRLTVNPVLPSPDAELKDLRPPADLSDPWWKRPTVVVPVVLAVLGVAGGTFLFFYRRFRTAGQHPEIVPDTRTPWEVAAQELERVAQLDLPGRGEMREHYTQVSGILRVYLGNTCLTDGGELDATDMSTEEISGAIWRSSLRHEYARLSIELLREADLVKFANHAPTADRARAIVGEARNIVDATRPAPEEAAEPSSEPARQEAGP